MVKRILLLLFAALVLIAISDFGFAAQLAYRDHPIWALVLFAHILVLVLVYRLWRRNLRS